VLEQICLKLMLLFPVRCLRGHQYLQSKLLFRVLLLYHQMTSAAHYLVAAHSPLPAAEVPELHLPSG
jgi:hypothetical protein